MTFTHQRSMGAPLVKLADEELLEVLRNRPPFLGQEAAKVDLSHIYEGWIHADSKATILRSVPAKLLVASPVSGKKSIIAHTGYAVDLPNVGLEVVNVAIYGNLLTAPKVVVRTESACPPSFLFGSQRCNCWDQWAVARELAAAYHEVALGDFKRGVELEQHVLGFQPATDVPAIVLIHLDSQSGMGSGVLSIGSNTNLGETAFMRHRGEYAAEQLYGVSMAGAFAALGIDPDPRGTRDAVGYRLPGLILDCLGIRKDIHLLTNNVNKELALASMGYVVTRHELVGRFDTACEMEMHDRINEFGHHLVSLTQADPKIEVERLFAEIAV